jgi:indolepyruvate ferredoxin oxidoreductase beta subunit
MKTEVTRILIAALGGEGGGVLAEWLVQCAQHAGLVAQATSVPGVAQRTGSTSYYIEWAPKGAGVPVLALSPMPGRVDVVVASEWLETARMMERGFVTPELTTLIASTSRVFTTQEKMHGADGRFDPERIRSLALTLARRAVLMDMEALTIEHQTVVSAVMFGAMAGAGVLPWGDDVSEAVIRASGKGVKASLAAFAAARAEAMLSSATSAQRNTETSQATGTELLSLIELGAQRCQDYQDARYADEYRQRLREALPSGQLDTVQTALWSDAARQLALWMCFEDVVRVADLKTRRERLTRIRQEAQAGSNELVHVTEHFKPGVDEIASILPASLGRSLLSWAQKRPERARHVGLHIRTTSLWGYLMLRALARLRPWRRSSLRYAEEHIAIEGWWSALSAVAMQSPALGQALARLPQVLKGYGDTQRRGREHYERLWSEFVVPALAGQRPMDEAAVQLQQALAATLAKPDTVVPGNPQVQPIRWFKQRPAS